MEPPENQQRQADKQINENFSKHLETNPFLSHLWFKDNISSEIEKNTMN